jgi:photosystem II stability/assembly factor-like uncharacterized protein
MRTIQISLAAALLLATTGACAGIRIAPLHSGVDVRLRGISAIDGDVAWASGAKGTVLRTLDGGRHWQRIPIPGADQLDFRDIEGFDAREAVVLAIGPGEASRIYRTSDGGEHWQLALHNDDPRAFYDCMVFEGRRGWMLGDPVESRFQVHATDDGGRSWRLLADGPPAVDGEAAFAASGTCIARVAATLVVATGGSRSAIHYRSDGATQWRQVASGIDAGSESKGAFSLAGIAGSGEFIAVGGDFRTESAPANATRFAASALAPRHGIEDGRAMPGSSVDAGGVDAGGGAGFNATPLPATPGYRSGLSCNGDGTRCIAVGPSGVDAWNGVAWESVSSTGYDAVDFAGNIGWASGDDGRIARIEIGD